MGTSQDPPTHSTASIANQSAAVAWVMPPVGQNRAAPKGAAIAQTVTLIFSNVFRVLLVRRFVGIWPYDRDYARLIVPTLIGAIAMVLVHGWLAGPRWGIDLLGTALIGGAVYYGAFLLFGLTPAERGGLQRVLRRGG